MKLACVFLTGFFSFPVYDRVQNVCVLVYDSPDTERIIARVFLQFVFRLSQIKGVLQKLGNLKLGDLASYHKAALTRERSNNEIGVSQSFLVGSCSCAQ